ncbi:hypothetical protein C4D60_Mb06t35090 [Musa balbisiana]|uniref:Uncharacterized protein n=1 Tax=Musa balbisiana TaxID=52838 RepID=A0A4S8IT20_MUSBA|nr:hypothetical protein C4D60_Mb06t35090 [Musa balbisiana]
MAEVIARSLGDGCLEGEHAPPALLIEDSFASRLCSHVFDHFVTNLAPQIALGKSHALLVQVLQIKRKKTVEIVWTFT